MIKSLRGGFHVQITDNCHSFGSCPEWMLGAGSTPA